MPISGYFDTVFATSGTRATVPDATQPDGSVNYTTGYGVDYTLDPATNPSALNIEQNKFNQLMYDITSAIQQYQQNGIPPFITTTMNGGTPFSYAQYVEVLSGGIAYRSLINSNTDTPPSANWQQISLGGPQVFTGGTTTGTANAQVIASVNPAASSFTNGQTVICTAGFTNTGSSTFSAGGETAIIIKKDSGTGLVNLVGSDIVAGNTLFLVKNIASSCWVLESGFPLGALAYLGIGSGVTSNGVNLSAVNTRISLTANLILFVSTTGSDSTGTGTSGNPYATAAHAYAIAQQNYDFMGQFTLTINHADGTYSTAFSATNPLVGQISSVTLNGNSVTPSNVLYSTSANCIFAGGGATIIFQNMKVTSSGGSCIASSGASIITTGVGVIFGSASTAHIVASNGGQIAIGSNYTIAGNAISHYQCLGAGSNMFGGSVTVTLSATPAFTQFALASGLGEIGITGVTYSGSATGARYSALLNAVIATNGGGANYFPGNSVGSTGSGGQYA